MPGYSPFNAFSDLTIAGPGKIKVIQKLSKMVVFHGSQFMPVPAVIQGNKSRNRVGAYSRNGVPGKSKFQSRKLDILLMSL